MTTDKPIYWGVDFMDMTADQLRALITDERSRTFEDDTEALRVKDAMTILYSSLLMVRDYSITIQERLMTVRILNAHALRMEHQHIQNALGVAMQTICSVIGAKNWEPIGVDVDEHWTERFLKVK